MSDSRLRWRGLLALALAGLLAIFVVACGGSDDDSGDSGGSDDTVAQSDSGGGGFECPEDGTLTIGAAVSETGGFADFDTSAANAYEMVIDEVNAAGGLDGCEIELIRRDTQSDPAVGGQVAQELINEGIDILLVPNDMDVGIAAAQAGHGAGLLTLSPGAATQGFSKAVGENFFNAGLSTDVLGAVRAKYSADQDWKNAYIVIDPSLAWHTEQKDAMVKHAEELGINVIGESVVELGQRDFGSEVQTIRNLDPKPDVIWAAVLFPESGALVKQLRAAGVDTPVMLDTTAAGIEFPEVAGTRGAQNVYVGTIAYVTGAKFNDPDVDPEMQEFADKFEERYGEFPNYNAPTGYIFMSALIDALKEAGTADAEVAAQTMREMKDHPVPGGTLHSFERGYALWDPDITSFDKDGKPVLVTSYSVSDLGI